VNIPTVFFLASENLSVPSKKMRFFPFHLKEKNEIAQLSEKQRFKLLFLRQIYYIPFPRGSFLSGKKNTGRQIYYIFWPGPATKN